MDETKIGTVILDLRKQRNMTQEQLAEAVGVSTPAVSKWETGASCPDVALLAPIARALDTDVNTLLSFTPTLSRDGLLAAVKELRELAERDGAATLERIRALTRRYPTDAQLRFQLSSVAMGFPGLFCWPKALKEEAWDYAEQGFAYVRQHGEKQTWLTVTYMLAGLLLNRDKLEEAEALLDSLPVMPLAPQMLYAALYQKRGQMEKAREQARAQLLSGGQTVLNALALLASLDGPEAARALNAYGTVAQALGYPPCLVEMQLAARAMEEGNTNLALEKLKAIASQLSEETSRLSPLWEPNLPQQPDPSTGPLLGRMLANDLRMDPKFQSLGHDARFRNILNQLEHL